MIDLLRAQYLHLEEYIRAGGVVMVPLALVSVSMWLLIVDRALFFRRLHHRNMNL